MGRRILFIVGGTLIALGIYTILAAELPLPGSDWLASNSSPRLSSRYGGKVLVGYSPGLNFSLGPILIVFGVAAFSLAYAWKKASGED